MGPTSLLYFDTSALTKAIVEERGTEVVRRLLEECDPASAFASALQQVELRSAIVRRLSRNELTSDQGRKAFRAVDELLGLLAMVPVAESILRQAAASMGQADLRSLDAIQLATALSIAETAGTPLTFVASDRNCWKPPVHTDWPSSTLKK